jgi:hypothetical protein
VLTRSKSSCADESELLRETIARGLNSFRSQNTSHYLRLRAMKTPLTNRLSLIIYHKTEWKCTGSCGDSAIETPKVDAHRSVHFPHNQDWLCLSIYHSPMALEYSGSEPSLPSLNCTYLIDDALTAQGTPDTLPLRASPEFETFETHGWQGKRVFVY